jgi:GST-like protein
MLFLATELYPLFELEEYAERFSASPETSTALRQRAKAITRERWRILEAAIAGPYLLASGFSATDLYITKMAVWQDEAFRRTELPRVHALTEAVRARPKLATVWARHIR